MKFSILQKYNSNFRHYYIYILFLYKCIFQILFCYLLVVVESSGENSSELKETASNEKANVELKETVSTEEASTELKETVPTEEPKTELKETASIEEANTKLKETASTEEANAELKETTSTEEAKTVVAILEEKTLEENPATKESDK